MAEELKMTGVGSVVEKLCSTTDGLVWAEEFMKVAKRPEVRLDETLMFGWFANAIEAGKTHERRRLVLVDSDRVDPGKHAFWQAVETAARLRSPQQKALTAAILLMSTRGDIFLKDEMGNDTPCSSMTMERIFDALIVVHDKTLLPASQ